MGQISGKIEQHFRQSKTKVHYNAEEVRIALIKIKSLKTALKSIVAKIEEVGLSLSPIDIKPILQYYKNKYVVS